MSVRVQQHKDIRTSGYVYVDDGLVDLASTPLGHDGNVLATAVMVPSR